MCVPNCDANYYYLEWWIVHVREDLWYCSSMTNDCSIIVCSATGESKDAPKFEYSLMPGTVVYIHYEGYTVSITATKSKISPVPVAGMNQGDLGIMSKVLPMNDLTLRIMLCDCGPLMCLLEEAIVFGQWRKLMHIKIYKLADSWSCVWMVTDEVPKYDIDNSKHDLRLITNIIANATRFQKQQARYKTNSVCWKRGYLLHKPPSTGKTTLIQLLASYLGMDLAVAPFSGTNDISRSITNLPQNTILAIEDVDCGITGRATPAFGQLLNVLDGISGSGNGRIVVITTNHVGKLDPALIRPGRMDVTFKVGMPNEEQLRAAYCAYFCDCPEMRPRVDLEARTFDFSQVPEDLVNESKRFATLISESGSQASCATVEGMLNRALDRECVVEVVTNCLREAKEFEAEARSDLESTKSDPSDAIVALKNIMASN